MYSGLKEDVYVRSFTPDSSIVQQLNLEEHDIVATIRPPASEAHYHNPDSDKLFCRGYRSSGTSSGVRMIILPRNEKTQKDFIYKAWPMWCKEGRE